MHAGTVNKLVLTQPGSAANFIDYDIEFNLTPYPQLGKKRIPATIACK
jgi:hypothetical protein